MPKRKQGEAQREEIQDFELIQLLVQEVYSNKGASVSTSTQRRNNFESFKARFQSYIDQIPSSLHSVSKEGFFSHFFLGSFSTLLDTEIAKNLGIEKIYFRFDTPKTLKVVVVKNGKIEHDTDAIKNIKLLSISEHGSDHQSSKFTSGELQSILKNFVGPREAQNMKNRIEGRIEYKLVQIAKDSSKQVEFFNQFLEVSRQISEDIDLSTQITLINNLKNKAKKLNLNVVDQEFRDIIKDIREKNPKEIKSIITKPELEKNISRRRISVRIKDEKIVNSPTDHKFHEIEKGLWNKPEDDIVKLIDSNKDNVENYAKEILGEISKVHSKYKKFLNYADETHEASDHGFVAGAFINFRYRYNFRVYLEQFAGRGYADIVLVPRGKDRSLNSIPIIIELKAGTNSGTTPNDALEQAKDYAKGFQPNTMRVLTISDNVLCIGLNLDATEGEKFQTYLSPSDERKTAPPTMQKLLEVASSWNGEKNTITEIKEKIKQPLERIYHTFPGTPEKGGNYFSRFLLGQLLLADKFEKISLEKSIFLYNEYPLNPHTRSGAGSIERPVTTFMLTKENQGQNKEVFIFHVREGGIGDFSEKKIPINLLAVSKITEICISLQEKGESCFFDVKKVDRYNSMNGYKEGKEFFNGELKNVPYPDDLKEAFDKALNSQHTSAPGQLPSMDQYKKLLKKVEEGIFPFETFIKKESNFQGVLHGAFSYYSDLKLQEPLETRALVLTEFQTGKGKRIDMLIHGIKFGGQDKNAKEYTPVGLELKGPRKGKTANALITEANDQIAQEYKEGVTYKTLTDGTKVAFVGVIFDKGEDNANSLILVSKDEFTSVKVVHSSIFSFSQQQCFKGRKTRSIGIACIDSLDNEKITEKEKEQRIKELFGIDNTKDFNIEIEAYSSEIIAMDYKQVHAIIDNIEVYKTEVYVTVRDNSGNDKKLIIDDIAKMLRVESYKVVNNNGEDEIWLIDGSKHYVITEKIEGQNIEYYLDIDSYKVKLDNIIKDFTTDAEKKAIHDRLHHLSNEIELFENKKYIEDIGSIEIANQNYDNVISEIKRNLLEKGVRESTFDQFKSHFNDLNEKVFTEYISNVEKNLKEQGIEFDHNKFDSAKIKGAKSGKFFSLMAIYDLFDSISDATTLGRHDNDALKQVFGINGILDAMDDVRESISISHNSKIGKLVSKIPQPIRQAFIKVISNPVVQGITFATIAYQFGYSVDEITKGNHHPLNYYWAASSGVKLASMSIKPISIGISSTMKGVSATTKILRGLSVAGKILGKISVFTMVPDIVFSLHQSLYSRTMEAQAIAAQIPISNIDRTKIFFSNSEKAIYEDYIRIKSYLNTVKSNAINYLNSDPNIAAVVQYVTSIEEKYSEIIKNRGKKPIRMGMTDEYIGVDEYSSYMDHWEWVCELEKGDESISFNKVDVTSNVKEDLSLLNISQTLNLKFYQLDDIGATRFKNKAKYEEFLATQEKKKVYLISEEVKYLPHITQDEYNSGLRIVSAPLGHLTHESQCSKVINTKHTHSDNIYYPCNTDNIYRNCQETFVLSGEPFIFTNPTRKSSNSKKEKMFPKGSVLYISGPKTLTAAANYPAVMHIPEGSNIRYIGSKNNETIFIIDNSISGTLEGGAGKENTLVMNVKVNNVVVNLHEGVIHYGSNNIKLVNTYNYVSNSDSKQNITTHCKTRLINVKNTEVHQGSFDCQDQDYEVRVVNKENVHYRGLKQTIFIVNDNSDNAKIVSDLSDTGKENFDVIDVQGANITQLEISEDIGKGGYSLNLLADDMESIVSSTKIDDFKNLVIQAKYQGITESVVIQDKSLSDIVKDIWYQELNGLGKDIDGEVIQNGEKKLKAFIQANILNLELPNAYQITKDIANNNNLNIPVSKIEVTKNYMGIPAEKVIIGGVYSDQIIVDFSYNNSDFASSYQRYHDNRGKYDYNRYMIECNHYQDIIVEGEKGQYQYVIKLPEYNHTLKYDPLSSPIRLNLKIKNRAVLHQNIPYDIIDFAELNVMDINSINIREGERNYTNECYNKPISDLTEDNLEIQNITVLDSNGIKWSLSIGLIDYLKSPEYQYIVLRINNKFYKIDSANLELKHIETNPNFFRYYKPDEQGLQIYHNQPINNNDIGLVDFRDKPILGFDAEVINDSLVLLHKNNTLIKVENWNTYQPAREMIFAFNDTILSNSKCIISTCNSKDIIGDLNKEKVVVLKNQMFNAIVQNNISEAEDLIRRIGSVDTENKHELTLLYVAIQEGRLDVVKLLFNRGSVNVKDKDIHGCNSLYWAAQEGKLNIAKFLVDKGANIIAEDNNGRTPLRVAACNGNLDMVKFFLNKSVDIESESNDPDKMMGKIESVRKEIINQVDASSNVKKWAKSFIEELRYSIKSKAKRKLDDNISSNCSASTTELTNRIYNSDKNLFDNIIKEVVDDAYGRVDTKKILSCVRSHGYIGQLISGYIAVFDAMQKSGDLNDNAIFKLAYYIKEAMEMENYPNVPLEKRSSLEKLENRLPKSVRNAIFASKVCIKNVYQDEYLYAANKCFNYDNDRRMAFTWTPKNEENDKFRWKIKPDGNNFYIVNVAFNETLYAASNYFNYDNDRRMVFTWISGGRVARDVWKLGPDGDNCSIMNVKLNEYLYAANYAKYDNDRRRVFTWIPGGQVPQGIWVIEDCGSNVRKVRDIVSNAKGELDQELLDAAKVGDISKVKDSVNRGADVNTKDRDGNTPSRNAVLKGHFGIFKYLVENGVSLEGKDHRCGPSICDASYSGNFDILKYLIGKGVDVNESDKNGWTPLHFAAWRGYLEVANFLIEKGANINVENIFGRKPIHIAAENNNKNIIEFFLSKGMSIDDTDRDGRTPLYYASWNGHLDMVKYLVDKGADIYIQGKGGKTSLDAAIDQKHDDIVKYLKQVQLDIELLIVVQYGNLNEVKDLVSQGASLSVRYSDGRTLMHYAAFGGDLNVLKYLIEKYADSILKYNDSSILPCNASSSGYLHAIKCFISQKDILEIKDSNGMVPLHYAAYNGKLDIVKYFINEEKIDASIKDNSGLMPLHHAVWGGSLEVVEFLSKRVNVNDADKSGKASLHLAVEVDKSNIAELLLNAGANIEARYNGKTPLNLAAQKGNLDIFKFLVNKLAKVTSKGMSGEGILHFAAQGGNVDMVKFLLDMNSLSTKVNVKDRYFRTPLYFAAQSGNLDVVELLLDRGANITIQDILLKKTLLHAAVESNKPEVVKVFLDKGIDIESKDVYGETPILLAVKDGNSDIVKLLLDRGASIKAVNGETLIDIAIRKGYKGIVGILKQAQLDFDKKLLTTVQDGNLTEAIDLIARGANIDNKDKDGSTLLYSAAEVGDVDGIKFLLDNGANIETKNGEYQATPLHGAVENYRLDAVKLLLSRGANINAEDKGYWTPLHYAADTNKLDIVMCLVDAGASLSTTDDYGKTPLDIARDKGHSNLVGYLEEKLNQEKQKPVQRKRRHHHGDYNRHHNHLSRDSITIDLSNQPEIIASSGARPSSWINSCIAWMKNSIGGFFTSNSYTNGKNRVNEIGYSTNYEKQQTFNHKPQMTVLEMGDKYLAQADVNGTVLLADVLLAKRGKRQIYTSSMGQGLSQSQTLSSTLSIGRAFEEAIKKAALKSGISERRLNIDFVEIEKEINNKIARGRFDEISKILKSYAEKACPRTEKGSAGMLSPKKFNKFMAEFNNLSLDQSMQQILYNSKNNVLGGDNVQKQQRNSNLENEKPKSYLDNIATQGCLTQVRDVM